MCFRWWNRDVDIIFSWSLFRGLYMKICGTKSWNRPFCGVKTWNAPYISMKAWMRYPYCPPRESNRFVTHKKQPISHVHGRTNGYCGYFGENCVITDQHCIQLFSYDTFYDLVAIIFECRYLYIYLIDSISPPATDSICHRNESFWNTIFNLFV